MDKNIYKLNINTVKSDALNSTEEILRSKAGIYNDVIFDKGVIYRETSAAVNEILEKSEIGKGALFVVGCSTSMVCGKEIGRHSTPMIADEIAEAVMDVLKDKGINLAAQCCEHLNRALIVEESTAVQLGLEIVSVVPKPKAGGSFATCVYNRMEKPVAVEFIKADVGMDIGSTLIGMHLKSVAVPLHLENNRIGEAYVVGAKTRYKYIGGCRAEYE